MPPKLVYIVGTSFAGSTVLGALLGQQPDSICVGELGNWTLRTGSQDQPCSCGVIRRDCPFWVKVKETWLGQEHPGWPAYRSIQQRLERLRTVPFLGLERLLHQSEFVTYADVTRRLYQSLQQVSGKEIIFEISKRVGRAQTLNRIGGLDVAYIHLVRDGRGFLISTLKHKQRKWQQTGKRKESWSSLLIRTSLEWVITNRMAEIVTANSRRPSLRIRYEDFTVDPTRSLEQIADTFSLDLTAVHACLEQSKLIDFGHVGGGNQVRLAGPMIIRLDESWKQQLKPSSGRLFWVLAGGTAKRFGYKR